jgi:hypothetical protein
MHTLIRLTALVLLTATALPAQSSSTRERQRERERQEREREFERRAERLGKSLEKSVEATVEGAMRVVEDALAGLDSHSSAGRQAAPARIDTTFAFSRDGVLDLTSYGADVTVTGWTRQEARVRGVTERGTRFRFTSGRITIEAEGYRGRSSESQYEVTVPEGVRVVLQSMSGSFVVRGVKGSVDLHTNNGDIEVTDANGRIEMVTLSGDVTATRLRGAVEATSLNGTVSLTDVDAPTLSAESTSGSVELINVRSPDIDASTVNGDIDFSGALDAGGRYNFQAHSGDVTLTVPSAVSARFAVETFSGDLDSDFPFTLQPNRERRQGQRLEFTVGAGEARVNAESFSGSIAIRRAQAQRR